jgi:uncharacterized protein (TIGR00288 family)
VAPWWLRASNDERPVDSPADLEAFAGEEDFLAAAAEDDDTTPIPAASVPQISVPPRFAGPSVAPPIGARPGSLAEDDDDELDEDGEQAEDAMVAAGAADTATVRVAEETHPGRKRRRRRRRRPAALTVPAAISIPGASEDAADEPMSERFVDVEDEFPYARIAIPDPAERSRRDARFLEENEERYAPSVRYDDPAPIPAPAPAPIVVPEPLYIADEVAADPAAAVVEPAVADEAGAPFAAGEAPSFAEPEIVPARPERGGRRHERSRGERGRRDRDRDRAPEQRLPSPPPRALPARQIEPSYFASDVPEMHLAQEMPRSMMYAMPERAHPPADERKIAMFVDFENIALGVRDSEVRTLDITLILERLLEKGKIIVKKAYADWERYSDYKRPFHEAAIELIDIPQKFYSGKNSADIKMVVDSMDLCYSKEHLDTFVLVSGDSDFSPLVSKLKENNKYVIGLGVKNSSSSLLIDNCDEFIYYEDVWRDAQRVPRLDHLSPKETECFQMLCESIVALLRENKDVLWGSLVKQTIQRKRTSFSEGYYGYATFTELLEDAERKGIIRLRRDQRSGTYIVVGFAPRPKGRAAT